MEINKFADIMLKYVLDNAHVSNLLGFNVFRFDATKKHLKHCLDTAVKYELLILSDLPDETFIPKSRATAEGISLLKNINEDPANPQPPLSEQHHFLEIFCTLVKKLENNTSQLIKDHLTIGILCVFSAHFSAIIGHHAQDTPYNPKSYRTLHNVSFPNQVGEKTWLNLQFALLDLLNLMKPIPDELFEDDTPNTLISAIENKLKTDDDIIAIIMSHRDEINPASSMCSTPLCNAIIHHRGIAVIQCLLDNGADVNMLNNGELGPIHYAVKTERRDVLDLLLKHPNIDVSLLDDNSHTAFYYAVFSSMPDIARTLFSYHIKLSPRDLNGDNYKGLTLLHFATSHGYQDIVSELIKRGANCNALTNKGYTPLRLAISKNEKEIADELTRNGAKLSKQDHLDLNTSHQSKTNHHV